MTDSVEIVELKDWERWTVAHREAGLPSQSWHYAWALSASGVEPKLAVVRSRDARMLMPFCKRQFRGAFDTTTILALSGASILPNCNAPLSLWCEYATAQGWVAGYIQLSPFVELSGEPVTGDLVTVNQILLLDLGIDNILKNASATIRQKIKSADRIGTSLVDDRSVLIQSLKQLYPLTLQRIAARPHYNLSPDSLERWVLDDSSVVVGAKLGDSIEAVSLFSVAGNQAEYHINASSETGRDFAAWLIWNAITRLRKKGVSVLNLGGGASPEDGVYQFKRRFGAVPKALRAVRQIYDPRMYRELCAIAGVTSGGAWFPAYRTP